MKKEETTKKKETRGRKTEIQKGRQVQIVFPQSQLAFIERYKKNNPLTAKAAADVVRVAVDHYQRHIEGERA